jgi:hypothetical protein
MRPIAIIVPFLMLLTLLWQAQPAGCAESAEEKYLAMLFGIFVRASKHPTSSNAGSPSIPLIMKTGLSQETPCATSKHSESAFLSGHV